MALAVALGADICEIYTDVDGVFTADPRIVPKASRIPVIGYDEILEMSSCGSKVLALRCVEYAQRFNMPLHVRSSFSHRARRSRPAQPAQHRLMSSTDIRHIRDLIYRSHKYKGEKT